MKITNRYNLPAPIILALERDPYTKGDATFSVTELLDSPQITQLKQRHADEIERDASDMVFSLLGRAVHNLLEEHGKRAGLVAEERLYAEIDGWRISGGIDLQDGLITDWKVTTAKAAFAGKLAWEQQLNCYDWLYTQRHGHQSPGLQICALIRDWQKEKALNQPNYPQAPIKTIPVRLWTPEEQLTFIRERVTIHAAARAAEAFQEPPPPCTDEERWKRGGTWALIKVGNKRATAIYEDEAEARRAQDEAAAAAKKGVEYMLDHRPGLPHRCMHYCDVAAFCSQWAEERAQLNFKEDQLDEID